jgi:hypothetical protein
MPTLHTRRRRRLFRSIDRAEISNAAMRKARVAAARHIGKTDKVIDRH